MNKYVINACLGGPGGSAFSTSVVGSGGGREESFLLSQEKAIPDNSFTAECSLK